MEKQIKENIKKAKHYYFMYNQIMNKLHVLLEKDMALFNEITCDYAISITPLGIFKGGEEMTNEELQKFIEEKRPDYE